MRIYFDFNSAWLVVLAVIYGAYFLALLVRRGGKFKKEWKSQLLLAAIVLLLAILVEFSGVSLKLWTYLPNNWPFEVWVGYFGVGLAGYQIAKLVEEVKK